MTTISKFKPAVLGRHWRTFATALFAMLSVLAAAQTTFFTTQQTVTLPRFPWLYRFPEPRGVSIFTLSVGIAGMTTVPPGMTVGTMNGGAQGGDIICFGGAVYRLDDAFGANPHLVQIGTTNSLGASPVFAGNRLFSLGAVAPGQVALTEMDPTTFTEIARELAGVPGQTGGSVLLSGLTLPLSCNPPHQSL